MGTSESIRLDCIYGFLVHECRRVWCVSINKGKLRKLLRRVKDRYVCRRVDPTRGKPIRIDGQRSRRVCSVKSGRVVNNRKSPVALYQRPVGYHIFYCEETEGCAPSS